MINSGHHNQFACVVIIANMVSPYMHFLSRLGVMKKCPAGTYGADEGLYLPSCSGVCEQGYYCPDGSTSPQQHHCGGPAVYCPMGSKEPNPVSNGYFTGILISFLLSYSQLGMVLPLDMLKDGI